MRSALIARDGTCHSPHLSCILRQIAYAGQGARSLRPGARHLFIFMKNVLPMRQKDEIFP